MRDISVYVKNFADPEQWSAEINGANVKIVGRFYDFCNADKPLEFSPRKPGYVTVDGPCHFASPGTGLTLYDVRVEKVHRPSSIRLSGEVNRDVIGDLKEMPADWEHLDAMKAAARDWLKTILAGRNSLEKAVREGHLSGQLDKEELVDLRTELEAEIQDPDSWFRYFTDQKRSPLNIRKSRINRLAFKAYKHVGYSSYDGPNWGCLCHSSNCNDKWPLFSNDAGNFADSYVCVLLDHDEDSDTWDWLRYWD